MADRAKHPEKYRAKDRSRWADPEKREKMRTYNRRWYAANREYKLAKQRTEEFRARVRELAARPGKVEEGREYQRAYRRENKERLNARRREWRERNPGHAKRQKAKRRAREREAVSTLTRTQIRWILSILGDRCVYCCKPLPKGWHLDHLVPLSRGGHNVAPNVAPACPTCNLSKGAKGWRRFCREKFPGREMLIEEYVGHVLLVCGPLGERAPTT
jgi:5-methylcytosine-specific restriction endonuclease McrA